MSGLQALQTYPSLFIGSITLLGLLVGSFLNVVIYRLPLMMERTWRKECSEFLGLESAIPSEEKFDLIWPGSRCPRCKTVIKPYQNIPVVSYVFLQGRCAACKIPISLRYPCVEALTGVASAVVAWRFGFGFATVCALILTWALIALSGIDIDHQLLPDSISLPMLWLGLLLSLSGLFADSHASIIGAAAGYLSLWTVYQLFKYATGKEGMGYGDFKLLALLGAWLGWQCLPVIILLSSLVGALLGVTMIVTLKRDHNVPIPFGPYLAAAGWLALLFGKELNQFYLTAVGL
jgi:leader peptidase (prepilin peptidase) / N-methyltransferase